MRAQAAASASPRRDPDDSAPAVTSSEQQPAARKFGRYESPAERADDGRLVG